MRIATTAVCRLNTSAGGLGGSGTRGVLRETSARWTRRGGTTRGRRSGGRPIGAESLARRTGRVAGAMGTGVISHGLPFVSESRATPAGTAKPRSYLPYRASVFRSNPGSRKTRLASLEERRSSMNSRGRSQARATRSAIARICSACGPSSPAHRLGQSADEDIGLMVLNDHAKGARHILNLGSRETLSGIATRRCGQRPRYRCVCRQYRARVQPPLDASVTRSAHRSRPREQQRCPRHSCRQPAPWWAYRHHGHRRAARSA